MTGEAGSSDRAVPFTTGAQVGRWLRGLRPQAGPTQMQPSERAEVSQRDVSELEHGEAEAVGL